MWRTHLFFAIALLLAAGVHFGYGIRHSRLEDLEDLQDLEAREESERQTVDVRPRGALAGSFGLG